MVLFIFFCFLYFFKRYVCRHNNRKQTQNAQLTIMFMLCVSGAAFETKKGNRNSLLLCFTSTARTNNTVHSVPKQSETVKAFHFIHPFEFGEPVRTRCVFCWIYIWMKWFVEVSVVHQPLFLLHVFQTNKIIPVCWMWQMFNLFLYTLKC